MRAPGGGLVAAIGPGMRRTHLLASGLIALAPSIPKPVGACSVAVMDGGVHVLDPRYADDDVAPSALVASAAVWRSPASDDSGCTSCGPSPGYVHLELSATDDRTPYERLGYKFAIAAGQPPRGLDLTHTLLPNPYDGWGHQLGLAFDTSSEPFSFDLEIRAIDLDGNAGPPVVITIDG